MEKSEQTLLKIKQYCDIQLKELKNQTTINSNNNTLGDYDWEEGKKFGMIRIINKIRGILASNT
jgi:hypothetical protein